MLSICVLDLREDVLVSILALAGIQALRRFELASSALLTEVTRSLESVKAILPRKDPFESVAEASLTLLWAVIDASWTKICKQNGNTLLHEVAALPSESFLKFTVSLAGAVSIINLRNSAGKSPLHLRTALGFCLEPLLRSPGIDLEMRDHYGNTALIIAVKEQHLTSAESLLQHRADVNAFATYAGPRLATPLAAAVSQRDEAMVELLLRYPELRVSKPLLLGVPGAPTACDFARSDRLRQRLSERARLEGAEAADPGFFSSLGISTTESASFHVASESSSNAQTSSVVFPASKEVATSAWPRLHSAASARASSCLCFCVGCLPCASVERKSTPVQP